METKTENEIVESQQGNHIEESKETTNQESSVAPKPSATQKVKQAWVKTKTKAKQAWEKAKQVWANTTPKIKRWCQTGRETTYVLYQKAKPVVQQGCKRTGEIVAMLWKWTKIFAKKTWVFLQKAYAYTRKKIIAFTIVSIKVTKVCLHKTKIFLQKSGRWIWKTTKMTIATIVRYWRILQRMIAEQWRKFGAPCVAWCKETYLCTLARVQCRWVRFSYKSKIICAENTAVLVRVFFPIKFLRTTGDFFYAMGFQTEYRIICFGRMSKRCSKFLAQKVFSQIARIFKVIWREIVIIWRELFSPFFVLVRGIYRIIAYGIKTTKERNIFIGIALSIAYLFRGLFRYVSVLPGMVSYVLPFIAAAGFLVVVENTLAEEYTLAVQVNGVTLGYVENEMVFEKAKDDVEERVDYLGTNNETTWDIHPTYRLSTISTVMTESEMANAILEASSEEINEGSAVYIDGELRYITEDGAEVQAYLDSLMKPYENDTDPTLRIAFNKEITLSDGLYFTKSFTPAKEIITYLSGLEAAQIDYTVVAGDSWSLIANKNGLTQAEIFAMNPGMDVSTAIFPGDPIIVGIEKSVLEIYLYRTIEYDEEIAYTTTKTESSEYNFGTTKTTQTGVNGVRHITAEVMYNADGVTLRTDIVSNVVTVQPIEEITIVGTYLPSGAIAQVGSGTMQWPVPTYRYVSRWASSSHKGVDICGPAGTPIYAVDAGVVIKAGWNAAGTGYGYSIVIDHGNGYTSLYGHGSSVAVNVGDVVTQGQYIMAMGSTGYSTGNHLHLEVRNYGNLIYPQTIWSGY